MAVDNVDVFEFVARVDLGVLRGADMRHVAPVVGGLHE